MRNGCPRLVVARYHDHSNVLIFNFLLMIHDIVSNCVIRCYLTILRSCLHTKNGQNKMKSTTCTKTGNTRSKNRIEIKSYQLKRLNLQSVSILCIPRTISRKDGLYHANTDYITQTWTISVSRKHGLYQTNTDSITKTHVSYLKSSKNSKHGHWTIVYT